MFDLNSLSTGKVSIHLHLEHSFIFILTLSSIFASFRLTTVWPEFFSKRSIMSSKVIIETCISIMRKTMMTMMMTMMTVMMIMINQVRDHWKLRVSNEYSQAKREQYIFWGICICFRNPKNNYFIFPGSGSSFHLKLPPLSQFFIEELEILFVHVVVGQILSVEMFKWFLHQ